MFNLRYHIASLVAVFLALAVGLLLGGVVVERGVFDRQKAAIVKGLQEDFRKLSAENRALSAESQRHQRLSEELLAPVVSARLAGRTIAVVADPSSRDAVREASDAIRLAGGTPVVVRLKYASFGLGDARFVEAFSELPAGAAELREDALAGLLAAEWSTSGPRPLTDRLREAGAFDGDALPAAKLDGVVVAAGWEASGGGMEADSVAIVLAERMRRAGVPVAAAESSSARSGCVRAAVDRGVSAVDHVETPEGVVSLVWLLAGRAEGYFGTEAGADAAFPSVAR